MPMIILHNTSTTWMIQHSKMHCTICDYNIINKVQNSDIILEGKSKIISPMGIHSQSKHKYINVFGNSNIQYHDFSNGDALTFKDKYTTLLQ